MSGTLVQTFISEYERIAAELNRIGFETFRARKDLRDETEKQSRTL